MEAADECALAMGNEGKLDSSPFAYLYPVTAITVSLSVRDGVKNGTNEEKSY